MQPRHTRQPRAIAIAAPEHRASPGHLVLLAALAVLALVLFSARAHALSLFGGPPELKPQNGSVSFPTADLNDGNAHFYRVKTGGKEVRFFALKTKDGSVRTALDACEACYREKKGYAQDGEYMRCNNCGMRFHATKIMEVRGGCNPVPLARNATAQTVTIREADLKAGVSYF